MEKLTRSWVLNGVERNRDEEEERDNLRGQKSLGPLKMSLEMAHKVIVPPKKNYIPQFLKQRDINSYIRSGQELE